MYTNVRTPCQVLLVEWCQPLEKEINFGKRMIRPTPALNTTHYKSKEKYESRLPRMMSHIQEIFRRLNIIQRNPSFGQCPICLEDMYSAARITDCAHIYHAHCLRKCLRVIGDSCPLCRNPILDSLMPCVEEQDIALQYFETPV